MLLQLPSWTIISPSFYLWFSSNIFDLCSVSFGDYAPSSRPLNNGVHQTLALIYFCFPYTLSLGNLIHCMALVSYCISNTQIIIIIPNHSRVCEKPHPTVIHYMYKDVSKALWDSDTQKWTHDLIPWKLIAKWCPNQHFFSITQEIVPNSKRSPMHSIVGIF